MAVTLFTDRRMLDHRVPARHPERPERLQAVLRHLERTGFLASCPSGRVREATDLELGRIHSAGYRRRVDELEAAGGECSTRIHGSSPAQTWPPSSRSAACIEAVSFVIGGNDRRALCLVRPPGHHARAAEGMGFCIYANVALAAAAAIAQLEVNRVLIADFDVHHGNGTQEIFYDSERVAFLSIHRYPFYPGTGATERDRNRGRPWIHEEHPPTPWHAATRLPCSLSSRTRATGRPCQAGARADQRGLRCPRRRPGR